MERPGFRILRVMVMGNRDLTESLGITVEMMSATTILYAAKRVAEELGYDPDAREWTLGKKEGSRIVRLDQGMIVGELESDVVYLGYAE